MKRILLLMIVLTAGCGFAQLAEEYASLQKEVVRIEAELGDNTTSDERREALATRIIGVREKIEENREIVKAKAEKIRATLGSAGALLERFGPLIPQFGGLASIVGAGLVGLAGGRRKD